MYKVKGVHTFKSVKATPQFPQDTLQPGTGQQTVPPPQAHLRARRRHSLPPDKRGSGTNETRQQEPLRYF